MERLKRYEPLFILLQGIGTIVAAVALMLAWQTLRHDHIRSRQEFSMSLWDSWAEMFRSRESLRATMRLLSRADSATKNWAAVVASDDTSHADYAIKQDCLTLLNEFEKVATSYKYNIGDRQIITEAFKDTVQDYYFKMTAFRQAWAHDRPGKEWPALTWLIEDEWKTPRTPPRAPLGQ